MTLTEQREVGIEGLHESAASGSPILANTLLHADMYLRF